MRKRIQDTIDIIVGQELEAALGSPRSQRVGAERTGHRHGERPRSLTTSLGPTTIAMLRECPAPGPARSTSAAGPPLRAGAAAASPRSPARRTCSARYRGSHPRSRGAGTAPSPFAPASASFRMPMICSSLNRARFMPAFLSGRHLYVVHSPHNDGVNVHRRGSGGGRRADTERSPRGLDWRPRPAFSWARTVSGGASADAVLTCASTGTNAAAETLER
jgi:hypothetical protein